METDETYMGGYRKNMPKAKRAIMNRRGTVGKSVVIGVKDRETNEVQAKVVPSTDAPAPPCKASSGTMWSRGDGLHGQGRFLLRTGAELRP